MSQEKSMVARINALREMTVGELRKKYAEVFGEETHSGNREWMWRRIAWRIQEIEYGGLSQRALERAGEIADVADARKVVPKKAFENLMNEYGNGEKKKPVKRRKKRIPAPGTVLNREYKGDAYAVKVLKKGFEYEGRIFRSLSAVAREITGSHWNGYAFFNL